MIVCASVSCSRASAFADVLWRADLIRFVDKQAFVERDVGRRCEQDVVLVRHRSMVGGEVVLEQAAEVEVGAERDERRQTCRLPRQYATIAQRHYERIQQILSCLAHFAQIRALRLTQTYERVDRARIRGAVVMLLMMLLLSRHRRSRRCARRCAADGGRNRDGDRCAAVVTATTATKVVGQRPNAQLVGQMNDEQIQHTQQQMKRVDQIERLWQ